MSKLPEWGIGLWRRYQHATWYSGIAYGEYSKALKFLNESLLLSLYLKSMGKSVTVWQIAILVRIKTTQINNTIANQQNPELMQILKNQEEILRLIRKD